MDPITAIIAGISLATTLFGVSESQIAAKRQKRLQAQESDIKRQVGNVQNNALDVQSRVSQQLSQITVQQEAIRKQSLIFQNTLQSRNIARATQLARATATNTANNQGALTSSSLQGGLASIATQGAEQQTNRQQNFNLGLQGFDLNSQAFAIQSQGALAQTGFNKQLSSLGSQINVNQAGQVNAQAQGDFGKTLFNIGVTGINSAEKTSNVFSSLFNGK